MDNLDFIFDEYLYRCADESYDARYGDEEEEDYEQRSYTSCYSDWSICDTDVYRYLQSICDRRIKKWKTMRQI